MIKQKSNMKTKFTFLNELDEYKIYKEEKRLCVESEGE